MIQRNVIESYITSKGLLAIKYLMSYFVLRLAKGRFIFMKHSCLRNTLYIHEDFKEILISNLILYIKVHNTLYFSLYYSNVGKYVICKSSR